VVMILHVVVIGLVGEGVEDGLNIGVKYGIYKTIKS